MHASRIDLCWSGTFSCILINLTSSKHERPGSVQQLRLVFACCPLDHVNPPWLCSHYPWPPRKRLDITTHLSYSWTTTATRSTGHILHTTRRHDFSRSTNNAKGHTPYIAHGLGISLPEHLDFRVLYMLDASLLPLPPALGRGFVFALSYWYLIRHTPTFAPLGGYGWRFWDCRVLDFVWIYPCINTHCMLGTCFATDLIGTVTILTTMGSSLYW